MQTLPYAYPTEESEAEHMHVKTCCPHLLEVYSYTYTIIKNF